MVYLTLALHITSLDAEQIRHLRHEMDNKCTLLNIQVFSVIIFNKSCHEFANSTREDKQKVKFLSWKSDISSLSEVISSRRGCMCVHDAV